MLKWILPIVVVLFSITEGFGYNWEHQLNRASLRKTRSIDLSASYALIPDTRLPRWVKPIQYNLDIRPNIKESTFIGNVKINTLLSEDSNQIDLHASYDLVIYEKDVIVKNLNITEQDVIPIKRIDRHPKKGTVSIIFKEMQKRDMVYEIGIDFSGSIGVVSEGLFKGSYFNEEGEKRYYLATHLRPNNARRLFPCFDEPEFKALFNVSISRPQNYTILSGTEVTNTSLPDPDTGYVIDYFELTRPITTYSLGFVISDLEEVNCTSCNPGSIKVWSRKSLVDESNNVCTKVMKILEFLSTRWNIVVPICKLDIVALPGLTSVKPIDALGLIAFKENDLMSRGYYLIAQEIIYQQLGIFISPKWWTDAHINKALAGFLAASTAISIDGGSEFDGKWPMTILYSIYYEFSKRYPHSRITGMKQETTCSKTELVLRMLNYTLAESTFRAGITNFIEAKQCKSFAVEDVWNAFTTEAHKANVIPSTYSINDIAESWTSKDRLPVVTITRNYEDKTAIASQRVYLRERPHDVPEQDKMLWWIPLIMVTEDKLNFSNYVPNIWMEKTRETKMTKLPDADKFIIINPEEIGPFPVNYDTRNWNLLATYLQKEDCRKKIPINTRAKLLHDAWNLAYAGDLSFATAFNMTLFMKYERDHLVWNPVFTLIDHIGRHIDMSAVHKKFETYVRVLLTPLYEELGPVAEGNEEKWKDNLRTLSKTFLCRAGYRPCIEEAQAAFKKWMNDDKPDNGNPVPNQYICPVFKWGTREEWEFGLQRVINFPQSRIQSERTYLLKTLAGCPVQPEKIRRLLNITILEANSNFTETDITLVFSMLSGGSSGYTTLFNFLSDNWDVVKNKFENRTNLWDNMISSATGVFTTQEGYDMVRQLYTKHKNEFGSAEHIIEKSLRNIKEEAKWSDENLPVIEKWLDNYLQTINTSDDKFMG